MSSPDDDPVPLAAIDRYYRALDGHDYDGLGRVLHPRFVHRRPDRTIEGRDRFVSFMRDERPLTNTTHRLLGWFAPVDAPTGGTGSTDGRPLAEGRSVAVRGRLLDPAGNPLFGFVDVHEYARRPDDRIRTIVTYTR